MSLSPRITWLAAASFLILPSVGIAATHEVWLNEQNGLLIVQVETTRGKRSYVLDSGSNISATWDGRVFVVVVDGNKHSAGGASINRQARHELAFAALAPSLQVDGLLGGDFLRQFARWTIDYRRHKLILEDP